jgi:hypothetical protein
VNFSAGQTVADQVIVTDPDEQLNLFNGSGGTIQLVVDLQGYFVNPAG